MLARKKDPSSMTLHLECGFQSFGNSTTIVSSPGKIILEMFKAGVLCTHLVLKRKVFVPYGNIKGIEMDFNQELKLDKPDAQSSPLEVLSGNDEVKLAPQAAKPFKK